MGLRVYINGEYFEKEQARVSVYDHGLLYGDGVFEGIRCYNGRIFEIDAHIKRLYDSAKAIRLEVPIDRAQMKNDIEHTVSINNLRDTYIRVVITRGPGSLGISPAKTSNPQVIIITDHIELYPAELYEKGTEVITCATVRNHPNAVSPKIKSLNYLNNILGKLEALDAGVPEAVMLNHLGYVAECTGDNIFIVVNGGLKTPPFEAGILEGITRRIVIELAEKQGIATIQQNLTRYDLYTSDECFLTGTAAEVIPVTRIDGRAIGDGQVGIITRELISSFSQHVNNG